MSEITNLLRDHNPDRARETVEELLKRPGLRLERIVSRGEASPPDFWYDQEWDEWVLLCQGRAILRYGDGCRIDLTSGDALTIPAGRRHRLDWVSGDAVWLALHFPRS